MLHFCCKTSTSNPEPLDFTGFFVSLCVTSIVTTSFFLKNSRYQDNRPNTLIFSNYSCFLYASTLSLHGATARIKANAGTVISAHGESDKIVSSVSPVLQADTLFHFPLFRLEKYNGCVLLILLSDFEWKHLILHNQ